MAIGGLPSIGRGLQRRLEIQLRHGRPAGAARIWFRAAEGETLVQSGPATCQVNSQLTVTVGGDVGQSLIALLLTIQSSCKCPVQAGAPAEDAR